MMPTAARDGEGRPGWVLSFTVPVG